MDEPTNHLDLASTQAIESALAAFPGAMLVVSHDEAFFYKV
ncbi:ABC transporter ATP-binding protein [Klebsiella pneumoniae IS53]|nr:ABC transporter ATP-binding protein [Klebsiella pneumoniae IS53]